MFQDQVHFVEGKHGREIMVINNYSYRLHRTSAKDLTSWRCTNKHCRAWIKSVKVKQGIVDCFLHHDHRPLEDNYVIKQNLRAASKKEARNSLEKPSKIIKSLLDKSCIETLTAHEIVSIKRTIYHEKKKETLLKNTKVIDQMDILTIKKENMLVNDKKKAKKMPEAVKEVGTEMSSPKPVPNEAKAVVVEKPLDIKPDEASSGTLPAGDEPKDIPMEVEAEKAPPSDESKPEEGTTDKTDQVKPIDEIKTEEKTDEDKIDESKPDETKTPSESTDKEPEVKPTIEQVNELLQKGREAVANHDYYAAADAFGKACEHSSAIYGDMASECAENYFLYGSAMLECGKAENTVLGEKVKEEEDDEEEDDDETEEKPNGVKEEKIDPEEDKKTDVKENGTTNGVSEDVSDKPSSSSGKEEEDTADKEKEEDEDSSLKVAWEMFELAKVIFERSGNEKRLSDTYMKLGEVGIESGHPTAMEDMKKCLEIRSKICTGERIVSETHFNIGLAYSSFQLFDEAIDHFEQSKLILKTRIDMLKAKADSSAKDEVKEIEDLLPDLDEKIQDMKESKKDLEKELAQNGSKEEGESSKAETAKPASNISHLVKRKRKLDEVAADLKDVEKSPKVACTDKSKDETKKDVEMTSPKKEETKPDVQNDKNDKTEIQNDKPEVQNDKSEVQNDKKDTPNDVEMTDPVDNAKDKDVEMKDISEKKEEKKEEVQNGKEEVKV